jgi:hypothetical protein
VGQARSSAALAGYFPPPPHWSLQPPAGQVLPACVPLSAFTLVQHKSMDYVRFDPIFQMFFFFFKAYATTCSEKILYTQDFIRAWAQNSLLVTFNYAFKSIFLLGQKLYDWRR